MGSLVSPSRLGWTEAASPQASPQGGTARWGKLSHTLFDADDDDFEDDIKYNVSRGTASQSTPDDSVKLHSGPTLSKATPSSSRGKLLAPLQIRKSPRLISSPSSATAAVDSTRPQSNQSEPQAGTLLDDENRIIAVPATSVESELTPNHRSSPAPLVLPNVPDEPEANSINFYVGDEVTLHSLRAAQYNGCLGVVKGISTTLNKVVVDVHLDGQVSSEFAVGPDKLSLTRRADAVHDEPEAKSTDVHVVQESALTESQPAAPQDQGGVVQDAVRSSESISDPLEVPVEFAEPEPSTLQPVEIVVSP